MALLTLQAKNLSASLSPAVQLESCISENLESGNGNLEHDWNGTLFILPPPVMQPLTQVVLGNVRDVPDALQPSIHVAGVAHVQESTHTWCSTGIYRERGAAKDHYIISLQHTPEYVS